MEIKKILLKKGELLFFQGSTPTHIHFLHSGLLEILSSPPEFEGLHPDIICSKSKRVGIIKGKTLISGLSLIFNGPYKKSIRAIEDSYISKSPIKEGGYQQIAKEDPTLTINLLNHIFKRLEISISDISKYSNLYKNICIFSDNISLVHKNLSTTNASEMLQSASDSLNKLFTSNGGDLPNIVDPKFLVTDNSILLKKNYSFPGLPLASLVDFKQCNFIKKFLKLDPKKFIHLIIDDSAIPTYMLETISNYLITILDRIESIHIEIDNRLSLLLGDNDSWASFLIDYNGLNEWKDSSRLSQDFVKILLNIITKICSYYENISGTKASEVFTGLKKILDYYLSNKSQIKKESKKPASDKNDIKRTYKNSIRQIFEFALIDKEFQKTFLKELNDFKKMSNPFNTEPEGRKIRRHISSLYWDLFKQTFIRTQKNSIVPAPVNLMLSFGFLDETLLEENQIKELDEIISKKEKEKISIPAVYDKEFLLSIYSGKENPSITEMGLTYEAFLRKKNKQNPIKTNSLTKSETDLLEENIQKTMYEIENRTAATVAVCSGSTATAFPVLTEMVMKGSPLNYFISKKKIDSIIASIKEIDFSVFYRETVAKLGEAREIIQDEIAPSIILLPSFGSKTLLWQDLDGSNRKSQGRIVVPTLFVGDILKSMAHTLACFRWELNRSIKGAMWADPVEGGLTGVYFDYVNFYKKNTKLSLETKEKITEKFKSLRTNRDRFADDYIMWILFEKDGIMRLNNVLREMFYKHVPFHKELRARLEKMPAFSDIGTRFTNIQNRTIANYERKFKKHKDQDGNLPDILHRFMEFINM